MISNAAFAQLMQQINLPSVAAEYDRFALYCAQLQEWNQRMNLTAITDDEGVAEKHFADSLLPLTMVQLPVGASLVDVGSGAGFPGLPMALARPDLRVTFLDSLQKRLTFLAQLTQMLGVPAATLHARAEDAGQDKAYREQFDVATARAVANLNALAEYCLPLVKVGGLFLALKGAAGEEEPTAELHFTVDKKKAAKEQLTVAQVYMQVAKALTGSADLIELSDGGDTYAVSVQTAGKDKITPEYVRSLTFDVTAKDGTVHSVALRDIAAVEETESLSSIRRLNQRRYIDVTADIAEGCNVTLVTDAAEEALASFTPSDGTTIGFTGERESIVEALRQLVLMLAVGILLVYLVMVAQFQDLKSPFIVMFTIPLAFTGGFLALLIAGLEINLLSMLGMIMLVGIIVNNGIVLVDYINQLRIGGMDRREAIADAAVTRLRPILMTSITTILGLIVMALGQSEATSLIQPLAVTCIGGLLYATLMTLFVVPVMYDALSKKALYHVDEADLQLSEK